MGKTKPLPEQSSTRRGLSAADKTLIFMNEKIKTKCGREEGQCIAIQDKHGLTNVDRVDIWDQQGHLIAYVCVSVNDNPDIPSHKVHAWIELTEHAQIETVTGF